MFRENSIHVGELTTTLSPNLLRIITVFDVFSLAAIHDEHVDDTEKARLRRYYLKLRDRLAAQLLNPPQTKSIPNRMSAWLWRVSLGLFSHDDRDDSTVDRLAEGLNVYGNLFPFNREWFIGWRRRKACLTIAPLRLD